MHHRATTRHGPGYCFAFAHGVACSLFVGAVRALAGALIQAGANTSAIAEAVASSRRNGALIRPSQRAPGVLARPNRL
jgi:hypothetical protein